MNSAHFHMNTSNMKTPKLLNESQSLLRFLRLYRSLTNLAIPLALNFSAESSRQIASFLFDFCLKYVLYNVFVASIIFVHV